MTVLLPQTAPHPYRATSEIAGGCEPDLPVITAVLASPAAWLASAADAPMRALESWERQPSQPLLLEAGRAWDLVAMRDDLGLRVLDVLNPDRESGAPVMRDACGRMMYFFTPVGTSRAWDVEAALVLGAGHWVAVPHPRSTGSSYSHWVVRPDGSGSLYWPKPLGAAIAHVYPSFAREASERLEPILRLVASMGGSW